MNDKDNKLWKKLNKTNSTMKVPSNFNFKLKLGNDIVIEEFILKVESNFLEFVFSRYSFIV